MRMGAITPATRGARPRTCSRAARRVGLEAAHVALERARGGALLAASAVRQLVLLAYLRCYRPLKCPPPPQATPHAWLLSSLPSSAGPEAPPGGVTLETPAASLPNTNRARSDTSWCLPRLRANTAHCEASRRVSVRLRTCARVSYPKAAPTAIEMVNRRTPERVRMQTRCRLAG